MSQSNRLTLSDKLAELLTFFCRKIEMLSSSRELNWNIHAETILIPILNEILNCKLKNVNEEYTGNFPGIDLFDLDAGLAVQVTSDDSFNKVKGTLETYFANDLHKDFKSLYFVFLRIKGKSNNLSISQELKLTEIINKRIEFDKKINFLDVSRILTKSHSIEYEKLESIVENLELEVGNIASDLVDIAPVTTLLFHDPSDLNLASKVLIGLVNYGIKVNHFSPPLNESIKNNLQAVKNSELLFDVSKKSKSSIILCSQKFVSSIRINNIGRGSLETLKNQQLLHLLFKIDSSSSLSEFEWIRPHIFIGSRDKHTAIVDRASNEIRKVRKAKEIKAYGDFTTIIKLYDNRSALVDQTEFVDRKKKIGYSYIQMLDSVRNISSYYIYLYKGTSIKPASDHLFSIYPKLKQSQSNLIVFLSKEAQQKNLEERLSNVKKSFKATNTFYLDEFVWKHCTNADSIGERINYSFSEIENFVTPKIKAIEGFINDIEQIENWFSAENDPILVITGSGGIGKTTVAKVIADKFKDIRPNSHIIFIEATDLGVINYLMKAGEQKRVDLYDFYQAAHESKAIDKDLFRINVDNGNFLLIIDGLDEVFTRLPDFDIGYFIAGITEDFITEIGNGKVILTCRTHFWKEQLSKDLPVNHFEIMPFNRELTRLFFESKFKTQSLVNRCLRIVESLTANGSELDDQIMPYVLDVVAKIIEAGDDIQLEEDVSVSFLNLTIRNDYVVYKIFGREMRKTIQFSIDEQCRFFVYFSVFYEGRIASDKIHQVWENYVGDKLSPIATESLKSHPLLQEYSGSIIFRYNFFEDFFKAIYLANFISLDNSDYPSDSLVKILLSHGKFGSPILHEVVSRCGQISFDFELRISHIMQLVRNGNFNVPDAPTNYKEKVLSGLFSLALTLNFKTSANNIENNTRLLRALFCTKPGTLEGVSLINLLNQDASIRFDFSGLTVRDSFFDSYESFWECGFDSSTNFINCSFYNLPFPKHRHENSLTFKNFSNFRKDSSFDEYFSWKQTERKSKEGDIKIALEKYLKMFYSNGYLQPQGLKSVIHKRYTSQMQAVIKVDVIEENLIHLGVLNTSFDKVAREDKAEISKDYKEDVTKFVKEGTVSVKIKRIIDTLLQS